MYRFHVTLHRRPAEAVTGAETELAGRTLRPLRVDRDALAAATFDCSFEQAADALGQLERMYIEPDGSFVWTSPSTEPPWQVDGNLYDRGGRLLFVDLKGSCPAEQLDRLLSAFGWPATVLMFQLTREALFLDEAGFRDFAAGAD